MVCDSRETGVWFGGGRSYLQVLQRGSGSPNQEIGDVAPSVSGLLLVSTTKECALYKNGFTRELCESCTLSGMFGCELVSDSLKCRPIRCES